MKNIFESGEVMGYYAEIDYCYHLLNMINNELNKAKSPIEKMVDISTGKAKEDLSILIEDSIDIINIVIDRKIKIESDYSNDKIALNKLINMRTNNG